MNDIKLSISLEIPKEPEYNSCITERLEDAMERVMYSDDTEAYNYIRKVLLLATKCHKEGKRSDKLHKVLGLLTPFMVKYGLEDVRGLELVEGYVTNPEYDEDRDED